MLIDSRKIKATVNSHIPSIQIMVEISNMSQIQKEVKIAKIDWIG